MRILPGIMSQYDFLVLKQSTYLEFSLKQCTGFFFVFKFDDKF